MRTRNPQAGATLLYGPRSTRADLVAVAQALLDECRANDRRVISLRLNDQTLRLRLQGQELALALSQGPLPLAEMGEVLRRRPAPGNGDPAEETELTDLSAVRLLHAIRQHRAALGVLLRQRRPGPDDPADDLRQVLEVLTEVAPPSLILWQATGALWTPAEFAQARRDDLDRAGPPLPALSTRPATRALPRDDDPGTAPLSRADRAARCSAGRLFDRAGVPVPLPRIGQPSARLTVALRAPPPAEGPALPPPPNRALRLAAGMVMVLAVLALPSGGRVQADCPTADHACAATAAAASASAAARQATKAASSSALKAARDTT